MRLKMLTKEERKANKEEMKANEQFGKLLTRLDSKKEAERLAAAVELRENWPDGMQRLLAIYRVTANFRKKRWRWSAYVILWFLTGTLVTGALIGKQARHGVHTMPFFIPLMQLFWWPLAALIMLVLKEPTVRNTNVRHLLIFDDVKIVGPLVDALAFQDEVTQQEARKALVRLLPRLQASDAHLLNGEQREQLRQILFTEYTELAVSTLKAYEHIGDGPELEAVERLLQNAIWDVEVRDAAEACLPFLQWRVQQMRSSQTLLRASEHATTPNILLRPAGKAQTEDETQLVRMSGK